MKLLKLRRTSQNVAGLITLLCGFAMMWGSTAGTHITRSTFDHLLSRAVDIDATQPSAAYNGKVVVAAATLRGDKPLEDEYLKPAPFLVLNRHVEMFQWAEKEEANGNPVSYSLEWAEGQNDFFRFKVPQGHANPLLKVNSKHMSVEHSTFGGFDGSKILEVITKLQRLTLTSEMLKDPNLEITNNTIYLRRDPHSTGASLGDIRVWYEYLPASDYTVLAVQRDEMSLLGSRPNSNVVIQAGKRSSSELVKDLTEESQGTFSNLLYLGGVVLFFGLVTILNRVVPNLDLRPKVGVHGMPAVIVTSAAVTVVVMGLFMILGLLG